MKLYAGLDGGSTYLKAALIDEHKRVLRTGVTNTGIDNNGAANKPAQNAAANAIPITNRG